MKNATMNIYNEKDKSLNIKLDAGFTAQELYNNMVIMLEWARNRHKVDIQKIADAFKQKNFVEEHINNPVPIEFFNKPN